MNKKFNKLFNNICGVATLLTAMIVALFLAIPALDWLLQKILFNPVLMATKWWKDLFN